MQSVPEVDFIVNYSGVTILSPRLTTPRFVPFDKTKGKCGECRSSALEIDYAVQSDGVTVLCNRMKQSKFVKFDSADPLAQGGHVRVKFQGKSLMVPVAENESIAETPVETQIN